MDTDEDTGKEVGLDTNIKYKRVPDGQQKRDMARAKSWKEKANPEMTSSEQPEDKNYDKPKSVIAISSSHIADLPTMSSASNGAVSSRTRSRLDSSAPAFQPISPVGQVDGSSDPKPRPSFNPQAHGKEDWPASTPEWAKAMAAQLDARCQRILNDEDDFVKDEDDFGVG